MPRIQKPAKRRLSLPPAGSLNLRTLVAGIAVALLATVVTSLAAGIALFLTPLSEQAVATSSGFLGVFSIFIGSLWATRQEGKAGLWNGFLIGCLYVLVCYGLASSVALIALPLASLPFRLLIGAAAGAVGGMVGVAFAR